MSKVIYESRTEQLRLHDFNPFLILSNLYKQRSLIASMTQQNFRTTYKASYLGVFWQILLPLIMLSIFYYVFGILMGGKFTRSAMDAPLEYALGLFIGLGFFNFIATNLGAAPSLMSSHSVYVKSLSFPLEVIPVVSVLTSLLTLFISIMISIVILIFSKIELTFAALLSIYYLSCIFLMATGISWIISSASVFVKDISAIISPITVILMFMCPIFYPANMVQGKLRWIIKLNPIALIIEDARACLLFARLPSLSSVIYVFVFSVLISLLGYVCFVRLKNTFVDVM